MSNASCARSTLASTKTPAEERWRGRYFTPAELVDFTFRLVAPWVPRSEPLAIVDPACGTGAFLGRAREFFPRASLFGLEIAPELARTCRANAPGALVLAGDALRGGLSSLLPKIPDDAFELWIGNPPYNGTSPVLADKAAYGFLQSLLPQAFTLPRGTSLRDDYSFFLLVAAKRVARKNGALAFVTSASLLDAFLYAPLRGSLLDSLALREVVDLGAGLFEGTRVRTCVTLWTSPRTGGSPRFRRRRPGLQGEPLRFADFEPPTLLRPRAPEYLLRTVGDAARRLDAQWRREGETLSTLVPINFPGLKTRFDELLVDESPLRLVRRLRDLVETAPDRLQDFADRHRIPARCWQKLSHLHASARGLKIEPARVRPFWRYAGSRHRQGIPSSARAFCYLDRRLIPRGDHRLRGDYDPHACPVKLVYNTRELPLSALFIEESGCIHDHRHARFAPLVAPALLVAQGLGSARSGRALGRDVPNLSPAGLALSERVGGPSAVFKMLADFINSPEVQNIWAPIYATTRELPVPIQRWCSRSILGAV
ncbi:MAG TPA: N-6 DNA methylase [Myxococcaceae bacterium]|nr:N-6 DNA methylase [Myxococcaceae bacterium]